MNKTNSLFLILLLCIQVNTGFSRSHRKIEYTVKFYNTCKNRITDIGVQYDGKILFPGGGHINLGYLSSNSLGMPMIIPDEARVTWKESNIHHEANIPLRSLIRLRDYFGHNFKINFNFCKKDLHVIFGKEKYGQFEYELKEIWTNQTDNKPIKP